MSVAENLVMARAQIPRLIDWKKEEAEIEAFMAGMPFRVPVRKLARQLAAGEKQKLEILKQLYLGSKIIILDEPTSVLTPQEADDVLGLLREMTRRGEISVAIITHKFREVMAFADEASNSRKPSAFTAGGSAQKRLRREHDRGRKHRLSLLRRAWLHARALGAAAWSAASQGRQIDRRVQNQNPRARSADRRPLG